ncbi:hypothetical protein V2J09_017410 [Rumex salicifolius]
MASHDPQQIDCTTSKLPYSAARWSGVSPSEFRPESNKERADSDSYLHSLQASVLLCSSFSLFPRFFVLRFPDSSSLFQGSSFFVAGFPLPELGRLQLCGNQILEEIRTFAHARICVFVSLFQIRATEDYAMTASYTS